MSKLAKVTVTFTHNDDTFTINEIGSFSEQHFAELKSGGFVSDDPADVAYGAQFGVKHASYEAKPAKRAALDTEK